jgi:hypothetical protein
MNAGDKNKKQKTDKKAVGRGEQKAIPKAFLR